MSEHRIVKDGATLTELSLIYGKKIIEVKRAIGDKVRPLYVTAKGHAIYRIRDVSPYLTKMPDDIVYRVLQMNHMDLPKTLSKEFWTAENQRLNVLERTQELWQTSQVVEACAAAFKAFRLSALLFADIVERESGLTDKQRRIIMDLSATLLNDTRKRLIDEFEQHKAKRKWKPGPDNGEGPEDDEHGGI